MGNSFHNSLFLSNEEFNKLNKNAKTQEDIILNIFNKFKTGTKAELVDLFQQQSSKDYKVSESSISRALSNLDRDGKIYKTNEKKPGAYGVPNTVYALYVGDDEPIQKVVQHKLNLDSNETMALDIILEKFIEQNKSSEKYVPLMWELCDSIRKKLNKITL